ncbi:TIGR03668 family PPOX class F420-dependent oxidoreductase [Streptomyces sp. ODS28]|uniref:TIGR03668 family PPOX class F420-dependent oxidoreductase n=1 Tax=Streptomyces sp. ODS28 TaxID=3136688 RepID=UPI0031EF2CBE
MRLTEEETRRRFAAARVARLATADAEGRPHLVPVTFAVRDSVRDSVRGGAAGEADTVVFAVDGKPKRHRELKRLAHIRANPAVSLLVDAYDEDWTRLWWARADGTASVREVAGRPEEDPDLRLLAARYPQYAQEPPAGPVVEIAVRRWSGWAAA